MMNLIVIRSHIFNAGMFFSVKEAYYQIEVGTKEISDGKHGKGSRNLP